MVMDLNDAPEQRDFGALIPDGTFVKLRGVIRRGGVSLPGASDPTDQGLFTASRSSDAVMLDWEFTVLHGPHARAKVWQMMTMVGGSVDERGQSKTGNISKAMLRAMVESATGVLPSDQSPEARAKRSLPSAAALDGIEFVARIGVELGAARPEGGNYPDKNRLAIIVTPDYPEWQPVMSGGDVAPKPTGAQRARPVASPAQQQKPAWQREAAPATAATPAHAWQTPAAVTAPQPAAAGASGGPAWLRG